MLEDIQEIFDSGQLTKGQNVDKFVAGLKDYTKAENVFLTTSATTALTMSLKAIGIKEGDRVAVSDFSWPATCNVVEDLGAIPVFIDVERSTFNMCPNDLESKLADHKNNNNIVGVIVVPLSSYAVTCATVTVEHTTLITEVPFSAWTKDIITVE